MRKNALNQYTSRTVPGTAQVRGFADEDAEVTVNGNGTWRSGEYFYGGDDADNASFPVFKELAVEAVSAEDETTAVTGRVFVAQNPEQFTYDADGNMTSDDRFLYTWNGDNRLVRAQELCAPTNRFPYTVSYAYDHMGRMVSKRITENDGSDTLIKFVSYLWDGWNIIRENATDGNGSTTVTDNVWGLDIDGTLQGAGGVGGLLAVVRDGETYLPTYDANGNISEYVTTNGSIVAHYDYSPFGETLVESGGLASTFTHRFSTKHYDSLSGLFCYGYRHYSPKLGRWIDRDPIEEEGGENLYVFCANNSVFCFDVLGLDKLDDIEARYRKMVFAARLKEANVAADNLEYFLSKQGGTRTLSVEWLRAFAPVRVGEVTNQRRFETHLLSMATKIHDGEQKIFMDYWDSMQTADESEELYFASGTFTITSYGVFTLSRKQCIVNVSGNVDHYWWDLYDWHAGAKAKIPFFGIAKDSDALKLVDAGRAAFFKMESEWNQSFSASYNITNNRWKAQWGGISNGTSGARAIITNDNPKAIRPDVSKSLPSSSTVSSPSVPSHR